MSRRVMNRSVHLLLCVLSVMLLTTHRLPAPISEIPTPAPERSAKPKSERTIKPKITNESSESSRKRQTPSPRQATAKPSPFAGTWVGTAKLGIYGNVGFTLVVNAAGTVVNERSSAFGSHTCNCKNDGKTIRWQSGAWFQAGSRMLTPNPDSKTAVVTCSNGLLHTSSVFSKTSP